MTRKKACKRAKKARIHANGSDCLIDNKKKKHVSEQKKPECMLMAATGEKMTRKRSMQVNNKS